MRFYADRLWTLVFLAILIAPGTVAALVFHSIWYFVIPTCLLVLLVAVLKFTGKRKVTIEQFAEELEKHLLGTDGQWGWDDTTSISIADSRWDRLRSQLHKFDSLILPEHVDELKGIIAALRRGEIPDVKSC